MALDSRCIFGIDEAGYGPLLGPMVVARADFVVPGLVEWQGEFTNGKRVLVDDSKRIMSQRGGLAKLEAVLLALELLKSGRFPTTLRAWLLKDPSPRRRSGLLELPWYSDLDVPLPCFASSEQIENICQVMSRSHLPWPSWWSGIQLVVLSENQFNRELTIRQNKHDLVFSQVLELMNSCILKGGSGHFLVDKLGGRSHYLAHLEGYFPFVSITRFSECRAHSRYQLEMESGRWDLEFAMKGDALFLPIALASMAAKYTRELLMSQFNFYWAKQSPKVRPTAGYWQDGQRFLQELEAAGSLDPAVRRRLVRTR